VPPREASGTRPVRPATAPRPPAPRGFRDEARSPGHRAEAASPASRPRPSRRRRARRSAQPPPGWRCAEAVPAPGPIPERLAAPWPARRTSHGRRRSSPVSHTAAELAAPWPARSAQLPSGHCYVWLPGSDPGDRRRRRPAEAGSSACRRVCRRVGCAAEDRSPRRCGPGSGPPGLVAQILRSSPWPAEMGVDPGWPAWIVRTSEDTPYRALLTSRAGRVTL